MQSRARKLAIQFLRATSRGPLTRALPSGKQNGDSRYASWSSRLFRSTGRLAGRFLSLRQKARIQEWLINRYRIPVNWQPMDALRREFRRALEHLDEANGSAPLGDCLEFGVYQGNSLLCLHQALEELDLDHVRIFGFDSFQGLPDAPEMEADWSPGQFRSDLEFTRERLESGGVDWNRTTLIEGFYEDSLTDEVRREHEIEKASLIMVDCDLYTSTREALAFCAPLIHDRAVIFFDDWHSTDESQGEQRAFRELLEAEPDLAAEGLGAYHDNSKIFLIRRRPAEG